MPKKKLSKRAALIKKVEKSGVTLRTDWSALYQKKKDLGENVTKAERKIANAFPGSSVAKTDMFGANYTPYEKKLFKKTKRPLRNGPK